MAKKSAVADLPQEDAENREGENRKPEVVWRIGFVSASVFVHQMNTENGQRTMRSLSLQKRYKDGEDNVKYTSSFSLAELPQVMRVLQLAQQYIESKEARLDIGD
jgi:hypothetical protein